MFISAIDMTIVNVAPPDMSNELDGGALGVAIVGSVFGAIYAAEIADDGRVPAVAAESIEEATDVANRLQGAARADLLDAAVASFDVAARWGLAVCMAVILLAAAGAAIGLSRVPPAKELPGTNSQGVT